MKILGLHIVLLFVLSSNLIAQYNYVPNYSFEEKDSCPTNYEGIGSYCKSWFTPMSKMTSPPPPPYSINSWGSSDYFNSCSNAYGVPNNNRGYQHPVSGNSYSGFILFLKSGVFDNFREYIEIKLTHSLEANKLYCLELFYSNSGFLSYNSPIYIGAVISDSIITRLSGNNTTQPQNIYATPQVSGKLPQIIDTINWIKISGSFIAQGGERYLTIGNFKQSTISGIEGVYVYIDDVKLWYCGPDTTPQPVDSMIVPNLFTPNGDGYNDKFVYKNQEQWEFETQVFNRWGNLVFDNKNSQNWDGTYKGSLVSSGVYFYVIKARAIKTGEVRIYRGTVSVVY